MIYKNIKKGKFISRPNRFIANIEIDGCVEVCHVKNTGRCKELLIGGADVFVQIADNQNRKTKYDLISVYKGERLINIDSQVPNKVLSEWIGSSGVLSDISLVKPESKYGNSRFDFYIEAESKKIFMEVKGVTLEADGVAMFPDAPTERGVKHIMELCESIKEGYEAYIVFVIQMDGVEYFTPNYETHMKFGKTLEEAYNLGVKIIAVDCLVTQDSISANRFIPIKF